MNPDTLKKAMAEAHRFLDAASAFKARLLADPEINGDWPITGLGERAAVKRASLDLTRALSAMRRA